MAQSLFEVLEATTNRHVYSSGARGHLQVHESITISGKQSRSWDRQGVVRKAVQTGPSGR